MSLDKAPEIPGQERILEMLKKVEEALPDLKKEIVKGVGHRIPEEGMLVLTAISKGIVSIGFKENVITITVL